MSGETDPARAHHHALYDLLAPLLSAPTSYQGYFGKVDVADEQLAYPHFVVWPAPGVSGAVNMPGNVLDLTTITQITAVGRDPDEVLAVLSRADTLLSGVKPDLPGRSAGRFRQVTEAPFVRRTDDARTADGQPYYMGVVQYQLTSDPAPA